MGEYLLAASGNSTSPNSVQELKHGMSSQWFSGQHRLFLNMTLLVSRASSEENMVYAIVCGKV